GSTRGAGRGRRDRGWGERRRGAGAPRPPPRHYWRSKLKGAVGTAVPADHDATQRLGNRSEIVSLLLSRDLGDRVDAFASRHGFTFYGLAASALALMLNRVTGEAKIVVGSQVAHREEPLAELLAGP